MIRTYGLTTGGLCATLLLTAAAHAQVNTATRTTAQSSENELEEIVVTAERRSENLQRTAVAVSVRQGDELQEQGRYSVDRILEDVPSVTFQFPNSGVASKDTPATAIAIRGIGPSPGIGAASATPATAYYVDGVLNGIGGNYDINQVQVLRGPQGTLYGRSATAGAVVVQANDPVLERFGGDVTLEAGDYNLRRYGATINLPAGDTWALRLSGNDYVRDGYYAPVGDRVDTTDGRAKLLFKPNENFSALLGFALRNSNDHNGQYTGYMTGSGTGDVDYRTANSPTPIGTGYDRTRQYWLQIDWNLGPATLTYIPALREYKERQVSYGIPVVGTFVTTNLDLPQDSFHTEELRLTSNATAPLQWQTGLFYYRNSLSYNQTLVVEAAGLPPSGLLLTSGLPYKRVMENYALFAESTYSFTDRTRLTTGLRGDYTYVQTTTRSCSGANIQPYTNCLDLTGEQGKRIWRNLTYKLRLEDDLTPSSLLYGSLSSAFLPGSVAVTTDANSNPVAAPYENETLTSLEFGSKNRFLDNRLQVNGDVFYYWFGGRQRPVTVVDISGALLSVVMTSPARMRGVELETLFQMTQNDRIGLNVSYTDAHYVDKPAAFAAGVSNSQFANVVPWKIDPFYSHAFRLPGDQSLTLLAEALYRSSYLVDDITESNRQAGLEPYITNGATLTGNLTATWNPLSWLALSAYVRNVSDERYKVLVNLSSSVPTESTAVLSEPRTYGATLSARF